MARSHGIIKVGIWADPDFRALTALAQRAYFMLISQPQINNCGVLPYTPRKWAKLAVDESPDQTEDEIGELAEARFVIVDDETEELLVRTYIKHDQIERQPNLVKAAQREFEHVESPRIRHMLQSSHPTIFGDPTEPLSEGLTEGLTEGVREGVREGDREPLSARTRTRARARTRTAPSPTPAPNGPTAAAGTRATQPAAAADHTTDLKARLAELNFGNDETAAALAEPTRAWAWIHHAEAHATESVGGYAWANFERGGWPPDQPDQQKPRTPLIDVARKLVESVATEYPDDALLDELGILERKRDEKLTDEQRAELLKLANERRQETAAA